MRKIDQFILLMLLAFSAVSCDLDQYPNDGISTDTSWETVKDAEKFRNGIYSLFKGINGGIYTYSADYQSDLFNATLSFGNRGGDLHRWDFTSSQYDIEDIWQYNYECINNCNNIINNIDKIVSEDADEQATLKKIKGEAFLMRAICYHTVVLRFAADYEPETASAIAGLPIVLEVDINNKPFRSTLSETYALIKEDIQEARKYLTTEGSANAIYLSADAIDALEARINLYMHKYDESVTLAQKIIAKYPLLTDEESLTKMWLNDESSEIIYKTFASVDERTNSYGNYIAYSTSSKTCQPDFIPAQWVLDLYEQGDIRKSVYFINEKITSNDVTADDVFLFNKYPGNPTLKKSEYEYYQMHKIFRSAEAYLIAAEAAYQAGGRESEALGYINDLRTKRGASSLNVTGAALLGAIKNEWIREFVGEGQRMNDLKRWHEGFERHESQNKEVTLQGADYDQFKAEASNIKFIWEIPANDLKANSNLTPNWD